MENNYDDIARKRSRDVLGTYLLHDAGLAYPLILYIKSHGKASKLFIGSRHVGLRDIYFDFIGSLIRVTRITQVQPRILTLLNSKIHFFTQLKG